MPAPDPAIVERQFYLNLLGWAVDDLTYSLDDLKQRYALTRTINGLDTNIRKEVGKPLATSISTVAGGGIVATDTGDGGISLTTTPTSKLAKWSYLEATFLKLVNAAALETLTPQKPTASGTAGTALTASRGDHVHPLDPAKLFAIGIGTGSQVLMGKPGGAATPFQVNRALFCPIYLARQDRAPMNFSKFSMNVANAATAGGVIRFAMWKSNPVTGFPDWTQKVFESGAISSTTTGMKDYVASVGPLPEGYYWCSFVCQVALAGLTSIDTGIQFQGGNPSQMAEYYYQDGISGAYPGTPSPAVGGDGTVGIYFTFA